MEAIRIIRLSTAMLFFFIAAFPVLSFLFLSFFGFLLLLYVSACLCHAISSGDYRFPLAKAGNLVHLVEDTFQQAKEGRVYPTEDEQRKKVTKKIRDTREMEVEVGGSLSIRGGMGTGLSADQGGNSRYRNKPGVVMPVCQTTSERFKCLF